MSGISTLLMKYEGNEDDLTLYDLRGSSFEGLDWWNGCNLPKHLPGKYQEASNVSFVGKGVVGGGAIHHLQGCASIFELG